MLVGELENLGNRMITLGVRVDTNDDVRQRPISAVGKRVLVVDLVDGVRRNKARANDLFQFGDDLIEGEHREGLSVQKCKITGQVIAEVGAGRKFSFCTLHFSF